MHCFITAQIEQPCHKVDYIPLGSAAEAEEIILVQLDKSEINYVSKRLEQDYSIVHCVDITELADFIKRRELKCHEK